MVLISEHRSVTALADVEKRATMIKKILVVIFMLITFSEVGGTESQTTITREVGAGGTAITVVCPKLLELLHTDYLMKTQVQLPWALHMHTGVPPPSGGKGWNPHWPAKLDMEDRTRMVVAIRFFILFPFVVNVSK